MIIGFDFDNTIIDYSNIFGRVAIEKKLINSSVHLDKNSVKKHLISINKENEWTRLQGDVYGSRILEANLYAGIKDALIFLSNNNHKIYIVSHKTEFPYLGKKINLHKSALNFIKKNNILDHKNIKLSKDDIFFEISIKDKIKRIKSLRCDIFIDDLESILALLPKKIKKILFSPNYKINDSNYRVLRYWRDLKNLI